MEHEKHTWNKLTALSGLPRDRLRVVDLFCTTVTIQVDVSPPNLTSKTNNNRLTSHGNGKAKLE